MLARLGSCLRAASPAALFFAFGCSSSDGGTKHTDVSTEVGRDGGDATAALPEPLLPPAPAECPDLQTGTISVQGKDVQLWVGAKQDDKKGPVLFYWHGTGGQSTEASRRMQPMLDEIQAAGGIAASFTTTVGTGANTGNNVWFTGDFDSADIILACAIQQLNIDVRRIYTAGCSAGGLQAGSMVLARAAYIAAAMPNSGGDVLINEWQEGTTHIPSIMTAHGSYDKDFVILHFADWSKKEDQVVADKGGYAIDCEHTGGHCGALPELIAAQWQFLKDHPFGIDKDPYADGLPSSFPSYCTPFSAQPNP